MAEYNTFSKIFNKIEIDYEAYLLLPKDRKLMRKAQILGWITRAKELMTDNVSEDDKTKLNLIENNLNRDGSGKI